MNTGKLVATHARGGDGLVHASPVSPLIPVGRSASHVMSECGGIQPLASTVNHGGACAVALTVFA